MMPALPAGYFISKQMEEYVQGKKIRNIESFDFIQPKYDSSDFFANFDKLIGSTILKANSNFMITDNGWLCEFGYGPGLLRYSETDAGFDKKVTKTNKTGFFKVRFSFNDGSYLHYAYSGWCSRFNIRQSEVLPKYPLEVFDDNDFTQEKMKLWLSDKSGWNVIETMALVKGATDIMMSHMNYIFWSCGIHPKTKVAALGEADIYALYDAVKNYTDEYVFGKKTCNYIDIFGKSHAGNDAFFAFNKENCLGKLCQKCGTPYTAVGVGGTKAYICPKCQKIKKANLSKTVF